jgi:dihydrofolate reductase/thymidylate synthase
MKFALVVAADEHNGIGKNNTLIWRLPADMKHFTEITTNTRNPYLKNAVIMGRKTWESLPEKHRPLKNRFNIILSRNSAQQLQSEQPQPDVLWADSLDAALKMCVSGQVENVFVIGGAKVYAEAINHPDCKTVYLTRIHKTFDCDAFFPKIDEKIFTMKEQSEIKRENDLDFTFLTYERKV